MSWRKLVAAITALLGAFAGLCAIFALLATAADAQREDAQAQWPQVTASVQSCSVDLYRSSTAHGRKGYWINCALSYVAGDQPIVTKVHSGITPSPDRVVWQGGLPTISQLQEWVDRHPAGTGITVHYDPDAPKNAVLLDTDMPLSGPHTPADRRLVAVLAVSCAVLLAIARITRPRSAASAA